MASTKKGVDGATRLGYTLATTGRAPGYPGSEGSGKGLPKGQDYAKGGKARKPRGRG